MPQWLLAHWTEVLGFGTGLGCVLLAARRIIWTYPLGIANNLVFVVLFVDHALYADAGLQLVYLALGAQGWWLWHRYPAVDRRVAVGSVPARAVPVLAGAAVLGTVAITAVLHRVTDSTTEIADAATITVSPVAQVMMNRRWIQSWWVWIAVDLAMVGLRATAGSTPPTRSPVGSLSTCSAPWPRPSCGFRMPAALADNPHLKPLGSTPRVSGRPSAGGSRLPQDDRRPMRQLLGPPESAKEVTACRLPAQQRR